MEDANFDIAFHGTLVEDCIEIKNFDQNKTVVFDDTELYGSTFEDIESLRSSGYVSEVEIYKYNNECLIEAYPTFLRPKGVLLGRISDRNISNFCEFITIDHHFLILENSKYYKIPYNKTQLVDTTYFSFTERHLVNKLLKGEIDLKTLKDKMSDKTKRILFNGIVGDRTDYEECMNEYFRNFGYKPYLYPKYGFRDLSEIISRSNAMCGTAYVLDKKIRIYQINSVNDNTNNGNNETIVPSPISDDISKLFDQVNDNGKSCSSETDGSEDENVELIERFDNPRFSTDDEDSKSDDNSDENHHTGEINTIISTECCNNKRSRNNNICFDPLGCDAEERECFIKENIYTPKNFETVGVEKKGSKDYKLVLKNNLGEYTISEIISSDISIGNDTSIGNENQLQNILSKAREGYKYFISSSFGNIFAKKLILKNLAPSNVYVRVLNIKERLIKERFFAYLYNGRSFIQVMTIDSSSICCVKGTFMVYLVKKHSKITDKDLKILKIHACNVISDVSFRLNKPL